MAHHAEGHTMTTPSRSGGLTRRRFIGGTAALGAAALTTARGRPAAGQAKPTISFWNGLTGADGKVMDDLIDRFTKDTGIRIEQQRLRSVQSYYARIVWPP